MIDQAKIGRFLKALRKEKGSTQEEIAEVFGVSSRSVSRWENGNTLPDLGLLVELADYYNVDIKEIIDGERKKDKVDAETKETLLRVADYSANTKKRAVKKIIVIVAVCLGVISALKVALTGLIVSAFFQQYNLNGVSSLLCISIDYSQPREYVGQLEGYSIYVEDMKTDELYFTTLTADNLSLKDAVENGAVSVKDWRKKAWVIFSDGDTEILRYENYEIAVSAGECVIRPIPQ